MLSCAIATLRAIWQVCETALRAAGSDGAAAARAAGCKALGAVGTFPGVAWRADPAAAAAPLPVEAMLSALPTALRDEVQSVRLSAAWALAVVGESIAQQAAAEAAARGAPAGEGGGGGGGRALSHVPAALLRALCEAAVGAAQDDAEKVRALGVRAVGALAHALPELAEAAGEGGGDVRAAFDG